MKILYIGDIMGAVGLDTVTVVLPEVLSNNQPDFIIAQSENTTAGKGLNLKDYFKLKNLGIDGFSAGNWTLYQDEILPLLNDKDAPLTRPANLTDTPKDARYKIVEKDGNRVVLISLLGSIIGRDSQKLTLNPLRTMDEILEQLKSEIFQAIIVNFHGDYSSEKVIIGQYLDGKVTAVIGDHWHVPTADARILPKGTAHISDVGMCGILNGSLGVKLDSVINRWKDGYKTRNELETKGPKQFNAVLIETDSTIKATKIIQIQKQID